MKLKPLVQELALRFRHARLAPLGVIKADTRPVGRLYGKLTRADGTVIDLGLISTKLVTTAGVNWTAGLFAGTNTATAKYHQSGTGTTVPAVGDTALQTAVTGVATGTLTSATNVATTVGTINYTGTFAITEWGLFTAVGGSGSGTLIDHATFAAINVVNGDAITFTFTLTFPTGG